LRVLEVIIEPGDTTLFHEHSLDFSLVTIQGAELKNEVPNSAEAAIVRLDTNAVRYTNYQGRPYIHRVTNLSRDRFVLISFEILSPEMGRFDVSDRREAPLYASELDNNRVRAWRLKLEPGQSVPPILQSGPGLRVFLNGDQIMETVSGAPEREIRFKRGDFEWRPPAMTRALRNTGTRPVELVDFELR
jgi:hypothetical protein